MQEAVIIAGLRTPIGRYGGALKDVRPDDLAAIVIKALVERTGITPGELEEVIFGDTNQAGEDNRNVARMSLLLAGVPIEVAGMTVNRLCGSGMQAIHSAAHAIMTGNGDAFIAGGVESMTRAPFVASKPSEAFPRGDLKLVDTTIGWRFVNPKMQSMYPPISLGETAEEVAVRWGISREEQDEFALLSQRKAGNAIKEGKFKDEIVPVSVPQRRGEPVSFETDEHPRPDTTIEQLAKLKPAFKAGGTVTAGNSSGINDGAAGVLVMAADKAKALGLKPLARIVATAVAGVHPDIMGIGPVPATEKALQRAGLTIDDIALAELNEAFAAQSIACVRDLKIRPECVNVNGGAIALGHPVGCSGARIVVTLIHEMKRQAARYGLATMCIGVGQGISTILENVDA
ncbi:MAG: acetyl-CoA C-acetyltransferase [Chloroflexi bacterium]|nr:acetyl-CoA C-acetyltransferase [Chloroflexota bacterium]